MPLHTYPDQAIAAPFQYDVQQSPTDSQTGNTAFVPAAPLRKSVSMDRPFRREVQQNNQRIQRSVSSGSVAKPNSLPGSLTESERAAFQRPLGLSAEAGSLGRGSGSSLSSSIFESNQWVIDYNDLVSNSLWAVFS